MLPAARRFRRKRRCKCSFRLRPTRENGIAERPQAFRYPENINHFSLNHAQSEAERILNL